MVSNPYAGNGCGYDGCGYGYTPLSNAAPAFSPTDVDGLALWLDPSLGAYQERTSPTTLSDANGDPVGTWIDQAASIAITGYTNAARPTFQSAGLNGTPGLVFDGVDDCMVFAASEYDLFRNKSYAYLFVAIKPTFEATLSNFLAISNGVADWQLRLTIGLNTNASGVNDGSLLMSARRLDGVASQNLDATNSFSSTSTMVLSFVMKWGTSDAEIRKDGVQVASSTSWLTDGATSDTDSMRSVLGAGLTFGSPMDATIGDLLLYTPSSAMSTQDIEAIESWLATRAGL